jgi:xylulokinase
MKVVAGVDSSTQSCTVVLRAMDSGESIGVGRSPHPATTPPVSEQHPHDWWSAFQLAMRQAVGALEAGKEPAEVAAVSVDAQAHGLVPVDASGAVIRPAKLWNDTTSVPEARELVARLGAAEWARRAGSVPPGAFTISKVLWLARHEPEAFARLHKLLLPHDWLTYRLVGEYLTDPGDASGTGYYTPASGQWDPALLSLVDNTIDWSERLPRLLSHEESAGILTDQAAGELGLPPHTVVGPGTADNQSAALGMGVRTGDVVVSLGTSGVVYTRCEEPVYDPSGWVNGNADAAGGFLPVVCTLNAAKVTDTFARLLNVDHEELSRLALAAPVTDPRRPVLAAYLDGERVPDRPDATGTLTGLRSDTSREQIARAAYEGVLAGLVAGLETLTRLGVPSSGRLAVTGGGARAAAYRQLLADLTGRLVYVVDQAETAAAGAAIQAAAIALEANITELTEAWAPQWQVAAEPRPGAEADELLTRYATTSVWSALETSPTNNRTTAKEI